jgi:predicted DNA-binding transcriptional regulator AlpA
MTRWLSLPHAAEHLDISVDSLRRLVRQGKLPQPDRSLGARLPRWDKEALDKAMGRNPEVKKGRDLRDPDQALEKWLEEQRRLPARRAAHAR